jgi:hypothetical protein
MTLTLTPQNNSYKIAISEVLKVIKELGSNSNVNDIKFENWLTNSIEKNETNSTLSIGNCEVTLTEIFTEKVKINIYPE